MLLRESCNVAVGELLDPVSGLPHPILNGDGKAKAAAIMIEYIPLRALLGGKGGTIVNEACTEKLKFLPLGVTPPRPLFPIFPVFMLVLLEGADEPTGDVSDGVEIVSELDGSRSCVR
jgi:hypothetical protein